MNRFASYLYRVAVLGLISIILLPLLPQQVEAANINFPWGGGKALLGYVSFPYSYTTYADPDGNMYLSRYETSSGPKAWVQKTDKFGNNLWGEQGVLLSTNSVTNTVRDMPESVTDGAGGVYSAWWDTNGGPPQVKIQRVLEDGTITFGAIGMSVSNTYMQQFGELAADGTGGLIASHQVTDGDTSECAPAVQRINGAGEYLWGDEGVTLDVFSSDCSSLPEIVETSGGVIVAWINSTTDVIKAQKIDLNGNIQWTANGVTVFTPSMSGFDDDFILVSDNNGGAYVSCSSNCVSINKINSDGTVPWGANGVDLSSTFTFRPNSNMDTPPMAPDSEGNVYVWGQASSDPAVVKLNSSGTNIWDSPLVVDIFAGVNYTISGVVNDNDDLFLAWDVSMDYGVWTQKISKDGEIMWEFNGSSLNTSDYLRQALKTGPDEISLVGTMSSYGGPSGMPTYGIRVQSAYKVENLTNTLDVENISGESIVSSTTNGATMNEVVKLKQVSDNNYLALVNLNTLTDMDWTGVSGSVDSANGKSYASITGAPGVESYSLLVPIKNGTDNAVVVCPDAASIGDVSTSCTNKVTIINTESASINGEDVRLSVTTIEGIDYWRVENLTQGGAIGTRIEAAGNNNNANTTTNTVTVTNTVILTPSTSDTDGDGLSDVDEEKAGTDKNKTDTDGDGLLDGFEVKNSGNKGSSTYLNPLSANSDRDKTPDAEEDFDNDGLTNLQEQANKTDPRDSDSDGDELKDGTEVLYSTNANPLNPLKADSDNDGIKDGLEDFDKDGLDNIAEQRANTNFNKKDTDGDGLTDKEEVSGCILKVDTLLCSEKLFVPTDPTKADTDNDGIPDREEALTNPFDPSKYTNTVPISNEEPVDNSVNMGIVLAALVVGIPLGYLLIKGVRRKSSIHTV